MAQNLDSLHTDCSQRANNLARLTFVWNVDQHYTQEGVNRTGSSWISKMNASYAERAKYLVKQALQDKKSTIIKAEGEAKAATMVGNAVVNNPGYLELRQLDAAQQISKIMAESNNKVYLDSNALLLNITRTSESLATGRMK